MTFMKSFPLAVFDTFAQYEQHKKSQNENLAIYPNRKSFGTEELCLASAELCRNNISNGKCETPKNVRQKCANDSCAFVCCVSLSMLICYSDSSAKHLLVTVYSIEDKLFSL